MPQTVPAPERSTSPSSTVSTPAKPMPIASSTLAEGRSPRLIRASTAIMIGEVNDSARVTASGRTESA